jgi:CheY-like chemotaxis protein
MQMYIAALRQKVHDEDALAVVSDIDAVSVSTGRLLNALLDISQLEAGAIKPQFEDFPIQEVLRRVARAFAPFAQRKNLDLRIVPSSAYVNSDPILLERIIGNFTSNAVRYTDSGRILIGCRRRGNDLSVEVLDTGPGIPEEQKEAIFDAFHQIHNKERDRSKGLGLGLAIAQRLAAYLGHRIEHQSVIGRGARFAIHVERRDSVRQEDVAAAAQERWFIDLQDTAILLIEDDDAVLQATKQLLESWGCVVLAARTTKSALELVARSNAPAPDLIIADYRLPDGSTGVEAITRTQLALGSAVPALIITGDVEVTRLRDIADQGYRVLNKPVRPAKLRALISHLLSGQAPALDTRPKENIEDVA